MGRPDPGPEKVGFPARQPKWKGSIYYVFPTPFLLPPTLRCGILSYPLRCGILWRGPPVGPARRRTR